MANEIVHEAYKDQFTPWIPNTCVDDGKEDCLSADELAFTLMMMSRCMSQADEEDFESINNLLTSGLTTNGIIKFISDISKYDNGEEE